MNNFKCKFCKKCNGRGCIRQLPGMGGVFNNENFILNCDAWEKYHQEKNYCRNTKIILAPMTGAVENVGYQDEKKFYLDLFSAISKTKVELSVGDGCPDEKLLYGLEAVKASGKKANVFLKPYPDRKLYERIEWALEESMALGIDTDAFNIVTMRNLVHLERKNSLQLKKIKKYLNAKGLPFIIKGIFTSWDFEIVEEVLPDALVVSNHGGRIETDRGSSADLLKNKIEFLKKHSGQVWVDGGIRSRADVNAAAFLGADSVMIGRPAVTALCASGEKGILEWAENLTL